MTKERLSDVLAWLGLAILSGTFVPWIVSGSHMAQETMRLWYFAYGFCVVLNLIITGRFRLLPWGK
jgi:hypothetical protein